ncbi:MAG: hypothetical protein M1826_001887 [Phylliscum demangeonii]|nr:MAG: hypothetical protein M1826_001887 [Phylliscum demangeonii]
MATCWALPAAERATAAALTGLAVALRCWRRFAGAAGFRPSGCILHSPAWAVVHCRRSRAAAAEVWLAEVLGLTRPRLMGPLRAGQRPVRSLAVAVRRWRRRVSALRVRLHPVARLRPRAAAEVWFAEVGVLPGETRLHVLALMGPLGVFE